MKATSRLQLLKALAYEAFHEARFRFRLCPRCRRGFVPIRRQAYCSGRCSQAVRTSKWRKAHPEKNRAIRRVQYRKVDDCKAEALPNCSGQDCEAAASNIADDPNRLDTSFSRSARVVARQSHCRRIGLKINGDSLERTPALAGAIVLARRRRALGDDRSHRMDEETRLTIDLDRAASPCKENRPPLPRPSQGGLSSLRVAPSIPRIDFRV